MDNKKTGYILIYRSIFETGLYPQKRKFTEFEAWMDLLLKTNYKNSRIILDMKFIDISRGQFLTSEMKLSERWRWSRNKIRSFLNLLQQDKMIIKKSNTKYTMISICNYDSYQTIQTTESTTEGTTESTTEGTTESTQTIKGKKVNKEKKESIAQTEPPKKEEKKFVPPSKEEVVSYFTENQYLKVAAEKAWNYYDVANWVDSNGKKIRNWKQKMQGVWFKDENKVKDSIKEMTKLQFYNEHPRELQRVGGKFEDILENVWLSIAKRENIKFVN